MDIPNNKFIDTRDESRQFYRAKALKNNVEGGQSYQLNCGAIENKLIQPWKK